MGNILSSSTPSPSPSFAVVVKSPKPPSSISPPEEDKILQEQVMKKPLQNLTNLELIVLCKYYKIDQDNGKVIAALQNRKDFNGADFDALCNMTEKEDIENERERLIGVVDKYVNDVGQSKFFVYQVVLKKFQYERSLFFMRNENNVDSLSNNQSEREVPTTSNTFTKISISSTQPFSGSSIQVDEHKEYDVTTPIADSNLTETERIGIEKVKEKIRNYCKEHNTTPTECGLSESLDLEAQRYVCEDRFMHYFFIRPTSKKNSRNVDVPAILRVKFLVSSMPMSPIKKKLMATFTNSKWSEYGVVHTGILIGEWKIDWYNNSLVHVECDSDQKVDSNNMIAAIDIGNIEGAENVKKALQAITRISCHYNANKEYSSFSANCQHFVTEILDALKLSVPVSSSFKGYFEKLKKGETDRTFIVNDNLARLLRTCNINNPYVGLKEITFKNRKELDEFSHFVDSLHYFDSDEGRNDFWLLKAFDRSFVLVGEKEISVTFDSERVKENGFFTTNGGKDENSIEKIKYSIKDVDFTDCILKR